MSDTQESELTAAFGNRRLQSIPKVEAYVEPPRKRKGTPRKNARLLIGAGAAGFLFLLLGVIFIVRNKDGKEVARLDVADGSSVEVQAAATKSKEDEWISLFNGKDLTGWKSNTNAEQWKVEDGAIVAHGPFGYLFYVGNEPNSPAVFKNFHLKAEAMTEPKSNSGIYFHTRWQDKGSPSGGYECQVSTSGDAVKTGSLYAVENRSSSPVKDNEWFTLEILVEGKHIVSKVNGQTIVDYLEPNDVHKLNSGIFALQGHGRGADSAVRYRSISVKRLAADVGESTNAPGIAGKAGPATSQTAANAAGVAPNRRLLMRADDWTGLPQYWQITAQEIVGSSEPRGLNFNTCLCSKKLYRNFELRCQVRLVRGNTGIQIRSEYVGQEQFIVRGPQADVGTGYWGSLYGEKAGGMMKQAPANLIQRIVKPDDFNELLVRCVGKHVTIKLNGETTVDDDFPAMPADGLIGLQLHAGKTEVRFKAIEITELPDSKP